VALSDRERNQRYRARLRGEDVPKLRPGRKPKDSYFRAGTPEQLLGQLLNIDPQRLRDLESAVTSRGLTLSDYVQMKREQLPFGQPATDEPAAPAPRDPITQALLNFDHGDTE
jgi:hypothetical protein